MLCLCWDFVCVCVRVQEAWMGGGEIEIDADGGAATYQGHVVSEQALGPAAACGLLLVTHRWE